MSTFEIDDLTVNINTVDRPEYLEAALRSLIEYTPAGASLQIVFNGTPEATRERTIAQAEQWQGPKRFVHLDEMLSIDESHNRALEGISTDLVNFMGDDDVVLGPRFEQILDAFNAMTPQPAVVTTFARRIAGDAFAPTIGSRKDLGPTTIEEWGKFHASGKSYELLWPGSVIRTDLLRDVGGFEQPFALSFDNRIFSQMSLRGPVIALPNRNFGFRIHAGSTSTSNWKAQNETVRFVEVCHRANIAGLPEPTLEQFRASEQADAPWVRAGRSLRDRSRIHFRRGGELALSGDWFNGALNLLASAAVWPPAFAEKVADQFGLSSRTRS